MKKTVLFILLIFLSCANIEQQKVENYGKAYKAIVITNSTVDNWFSGTSRATYIKLIDNQEFFELSGLWGDKGDTITVYRTNSNLFYYKYSLEKQL